MVKWDPKVISGFQLHLAQDNKLLSATLIIPVSPTWGVFVAAGVCSRVSPPLEWTTPGMRFSPCGTWRRESLALTVVELVGLRHHGHRDGAAIGLVEEAVVGVCLWEGHLPLAVEVEGIYQDQACQLVHSPFTK